MRKELKFPIITLNNNKTAYGGNQEWYRQSFKRQACCGSTAGANLAAYYASFDLNTAKLYSGNTNEYQQSEYVSAMEEMSTYMKPNMFGYPYIRKFTKQFVNFCSERGVEMEANLLTKVHSTEEALTFVKNSIDAGQPVALLILFHRARSLREANWHWMTITGYIEEDNKNETQIILSNYGNRELVTSNILFEVHFKNILRLVSFERKSSK